MEAPRNFIILLATLMLAVGLPLFVAGAQNERDQQEDFLPGEIWRRGDGLGYNVSLNLGSNGKYVARWTGCLGEYGRSEGTWSEMEYGVVLRPAREEGMMQGHLRRLDRVALGGEERLVPAEDIEDARRFDGGEPFSRFYAFKLSRIADDAPVSDQAKEPTR